MWIELAINVNRGEKNQPSITYFNDLFETSSIYIYTTYNKSVQMRTVRNSSLGFLVRWVFFFNNLNNKILINVVIKRDKAMKRTEQLHTNEHGTSRTGEDTYFDWQMQKCKGSNWGDGLTLIEAHRVREWEEYDRRMKRENEKTLKYTQKKLNKCVLLSSHTVWECISHNHVVKAIDD